MNIKMNRAFNMTIIAFVSTLLIVSLCTLNPIESVIPKSVAQTGTFTDTITSTIFFPVFANKKIVPWFKLFGDIIHESDTSYLMTLNHNSLPPIHGKQFVVGNVTWESNEETINLMYHPEVDLITRFPTYTISNPEVDSYFEVLDPNTFNPINRIYAPEPLRPFLDLHDLRFSPDGKRVAMTIFRPTDKKYNINGEMRHLLDFILIEINWPEMDTITFMWHGEDHWNPNDSTRPPENDLNIPYNYAHVNSIAYNPYGLRQILISNRHMNEVSNINLDTGEILWRLGGVNSDFSFINDGGFSYQHCANYTKQGSVLLFDNANLTGKKSRVVEYSLNHHTMEATKIYEILGEGFSPAQGCVFRHDEGLSTQKDIVSWGMIRRNNFNAPQVEIFDVNGKSLFQLENQNGYKQYSTYRADIMVRPHGNKLTE